MAWASRSRRAAERFELLEETLRIARAMSAGDPRRSTGRHYRLAEPINVPPARRCRGPGRRIMIGGGGERKTLRLVASTPTRATSSSPTRARAATSSTVLRAHCEAIGRDSGRDRDDRAARGGPPTGPPAPGRRRGALRGQADEGIEHVIVNLPDAHDRATWRRSAAR